MAILQHLGLKLKFIGIHSVKQKGETLNAIPSHTSVLTKAKNAHVQMVSYTTE